MNHQNYQERIGLYVDNALSDSESAKLFAHLSRCDDCRAFVKATMAVHAHIAEEELAEVSLSLDRRVLTSVATASDRSERRPWYAPIWFTRISIPLPAAASILFLIMVGSLLVGPILAQSPQHQTEILEQLVSKLPASLQQLHLNK